MEEKNDSKMSEFADIYNLASSVLGRPLADMMRLDAIVKARKRKLDAKKSLRLLAEVNKSATDELIALLPEEHRNCPYEKKLEACEELKYKLAKAIEYQMWDTYNCNPFNFCNRKGRKNNAGSLDGCLEKWNERCETRAKEFHECSDIDQLMFDIKRMMYLLTTRDFKNRKELMDKLLMLVDAAFSRMADFRMKWKSEAAELEQSIPLKEIVSEMFDSQDEADRYFCICKRLLPEVIATYYVTDFEACRELLSIRTGEKAKEIEERDFVYLNELDELSYDMYIGNRVSLSKYIHTFHHNYVERARGIDDIVDMDDLDDIMYLTTKYGGDFYEF